MSCERNRGALFAQLAVEVPIGQALGGDADTAARCLTTLYETASRRTEVSPLLADALTLALFAEMRGRGLTPPTHSASGLPLPAARQGYAAVMQTLRAIRAGGDLPALAQEVRQALNQSAAEVRQPLSLPVPASSLLASAVAPSASLDDATAADSTLPSCAPSDPPGPLDPALQELLERQMCRWPSKLVQQLRDFANGQHPAEPEKLALALSKLARALQRHAAHQPSPVPLLAWAQQFRAGSLAHQHALAVALLTTLGRARCATCGQWLASATPAYHWCPSRTFDWDGYNGFGLDRYGLTRWGSRADGRPVPRRHTLLDAGKGFITPTDPINNAAMADLWGRVASAIAGHECRVVLQSGGFATDMRGTIYADPYPLGEDADPRHNLIVTKAGIYHEIGHELITPPEDWALMLAIRDGTETVEGIDRGRAMLPKLYNIVEDGRIEREMASRFAGVAETLAAQCAIYPRWSERVGPGVPVADEVVWALLYTVLPYFRVRDEVRAAMSERGRALFEELEPIALAGALGGSEDSLTATLEIARRLEAAGIWDVPETSATAPPPPGPNTPRRAPPRRAPSGAAAPPEAHSPRTDAGAAQGAGEGALSEAALERVLNDLENQAIVAAEREIARQGRYDVLGRLLHAPLTVNITAPIVASFNGPTNLQRYRTPEGRVATVETGAPLSTDLGLRAQLRARRAEQQEIAGRLARRLESIRQETIRRLRMQTEGTLDRRRLPAALAGRQEVRTRISVEQETGMAVSVLVDQSHSMKEHITEGRLYDATCIVGQALEQLDIPYEVRGHGGLSLQYKAMDEPVLAEERAARLTQDDSWSNATTAPVVGLATTALLGREDQNRLIVNLMDGDMDDHAAAVRQYEAARKAGVVTFGVFLGQPEAEQAERMSELFGKRNWRPIESLAELPKVVGQRIADIFESLGGA